MNALRGRGTRLPERDEGVASCRFWPVKTIMRSTSKGRGQKTYNPWGQRNGDMLGFITDGRGTLKEISRYSGHNCHSYVTSNPRYNHITVM
jgi:hypothetical protein